ncbi:MAG TPA: hypothetical protein VKQ06_12555 [Gammaproteobacteria bacterium]|nr:hypothetical protein [Gammaproteobacteria bacterium]
MNFASTSFGVFSPSALIVALICALILKIARGWMAMGFPFGFLIVIAAAIPLLNYFFEIIEYRALGKPGWPVLSVDTLLAFRNQLSLVFSGVAVAAALVRAMFVAGGLGALGDVFGMFVLFAVPVSVAVLAVTRELSKSINPVFLMRTVVRLELGYLVILLLSGLWWLIARRALSSGTFVWIVIATLTLLMLGYGIGSIVFRYRRKLGLQSAHAPEARVAADQKRLDNQRDDALATAWSLASRGNVNGAIRHVRDYAFQEPDALSCETWMFHRMARWQLHAPALRFGEELARRLIDAGYEHDAAKVEVVCDALRRAAQHSDSD